MNEYLYIFVTICISVFKQRADEEAVVDQGGTSTVLNIHYEKEELEGKSQGGQTASPLGDPGSRPDSFLSVRLNFPSFSFPSRDDAPTCPVGSPEAWDSAQGTGKLNININNNLFFEDMKYLFSSPIF